MNLYLYSILYRVFYEIFYWLVSNAFYKVLYMLFYRVYTGYARVIIYEGYSIRCSIGYSRCILRCVYGICNGY